MQVQESIPEHSLAACPTLGSPLASGLGSSSDSLATFSFGFVEDALYMSVMDAITTQNPRLAADNLFTRIKERSPQDGIGTSDLSSSDGASKFCISAALHCRNSPSSTAGRAKKDLQIWPEKSKDQSAGLMTAYTFRKTTHSGKICSGGKIQTWRAASKTSSGVAPRRPYIML